MELGGKLCLVVHKTHLLLNIWLLASWEISIFLAVRKLREVQKLKEFTFNKSTHTHTLSFDTDYLSLDTILRNEIRMVQIQHLTSKKSAKFSCRVALTFPLQITKLIETRFRCMSTGDS